jgi:hypothetical protein
VPGLAEVLGRVLVLGGIATPHVTALYAKAQMDPRVAGLYAVFTHVLVGGRDFDLIEMRAFRRHEILLSRELRVESREVKGLSFSAPAPSGAGSYVNRTTGILRFAQNDNLQLLTFAFRLLTLDS